MDITFDPQHCNDFWEGKDFGRPLISFWVGSFSIPDLYPSSMKAIPDGPLTPDDLVFESFREDYLSLFEKNLQTPGDVPWAAFPLMTIPWVEAIIGCPIRKKDGNIWAESSMENLETFSMHPSDLEGNPWMHKLLEFTCWLVEISQDRFPVALSLMRGPSDLLSAMRSAARMCLDLYDFPELVMDVMQKLTILWIDIANRQREIIPPYKGGYSFGQIYLWGDRPCGWFQDDAMALISPKYYKKFFLPFEQRLAVSLPRSGIHLHPRSLFAVDDLLEIPELGIIEVNYENPGPSLAEMLPAISRITKRKRLVLWGEFSEEDFQFLRDNIGSRNLCLQINVPSREAAFLKMACVEKVWNNKKMAATRIG